MVRLVEVPLRHRGRTVGTRLEVVRPATCVGGHGVRYAHRAPCPGCGLPCAQWSCGRGCVWLVDADHVHGDVREWATVVRLDGTVERVEQ